MNYIKQTILGLIIFSTSTSFAQSNDKKVLDAMVKGDYKTAVVQLEKANAKEPNNVKVLQKC